MIPTVLALLLSAASSQSGAVVLVAASGGRDVHLHDAATLARVATIAVGPGPHEIAVSADGRRAFVADAGAPDRPGATISVIDLATRALAKTIELPPGCKPHDLRVSRDGSRLWSTCAPAQRIVEIDVASGAATRAWETGRDGGWMLVAAPDERTIYVANLEGRSVSVVSRDTGDVRTIELDGAAMGMDVSPDGRELWVGGIDVSRIWIIDTASGRVTARIDGTYARPGRIRFLPGGGRVVVQHGGHRLSVVDRSTRAAIATAELPAEAKCVAITPDGRRAFVGHPGANAVTVLDLGTMRVAGRFESGPTPDGIALAAR